MWYAAARPWAALKLSELYLQKETIKARKTLASSKESNNYHSCTMKSDYLCCSQQNPSDSGTVNKVTARPADKGAAKKA